MIICECSICDCWVIGNNNDNDDRNEWLIGTIILIQYHCNNEKEKHHNQAERIDILIIIESCIGIKNRFETNKQTIN